MANACPMRADTVRKSLLLFRVDFHAYEQPQIDGMRTCLARAHAPHDSNAGRPAIFRDALGGYPLLLWPCGGANPKSLVAKTKNGPPGAWLFPRVSVSGGAIDHLFQRLAVEEAAQVVDEQPRHEAVALRMRAADMRQHDDAVGGPERMAGGQGLLAEDVEQGAGDPLLPERRDQVVVLDDVA